ncbi:MAG: hypothetical protein CSYNP_03819 [Syntrophus sp. SKADARSKE-3]|nr:hypothetical protein [Syntrophus sp. SKADARSKE-3]
MSVIWVRNTARYRQNILFKCDIHSIFVNTRHIGKFSRNINLPFGVDADKVDATYEKGILTIFLPRAEKEKPRKISIKAS